MSSRIYRHYFRTEDAAREAAAELNHGNRVGNAGAVVAFRGGCLVYVRLEYATPMLGRHLAALAAADYDARHGARADGLPPSDADPETGVQYGEVA